MTDAISPMLATLLAQFDYAPWPRLPKLEPYCRTKLLPLTGPDNYRYTMDRPWLEQALARLPLPVEDEYRLLVCTYVVTNFELHQLLGQGLLAGEWSQPAYCRYALQLWQLVRYHQIDIYRLIQQWGRLAPGGGFDYPRMGLAAMHLALLGDKARLRECLALVQNAPSLCQASGYVRPYFIEAFALQVTSRFFGWGPVPLGVDLSQEPLYLALLTLWDSDDLATVGHLLTQACHLHTYSELNNPRFNRKEAIIGWWLYWPLEVLLVLRLRQWVGLPLPVVEHPLLAPPFNVLPPALEDPSEEWLYDALPTHFASNYPEAPAVLAEMCRSPAPAGDDVWPSRSELETVLARGVPNWPPQRGAVAKPKKTRKSTPATEE